ncbi:MAG: hypothetical protein GY753_01735 [Gammaproteobacteria bacterium]|nr:hypothetical protein [Gammaproteobacteria bacterium]
MAKSSSFSWQGFLLRLIAALVLVFASYNPEGYSYYDWALLDFSQFTILKGFVGVVLLIGWTILLRATVRSLGPFGIILALAFFGLLIWLIVDWLAIATDDLRVISYIVELVLAGILSAGVSWSHIRRRITGQLDTDELSDT